MPISVASCTAMSSHPISLCRCLFPVRGAVLIDFGVAHAVAEDVGRRPTHIEASLPYSAPELLRGHAPSAATDEYCIGSARPSS